MTKSEIISRNTQVFDFEKTQISNFFWENYKCQISIMYDLSPIFLSTIMAAVRVTNRVTIRLTIIVFLCIYTLLI